MSQALGNVLPLAVAVAVFPVPIVADVLMVSSNRGRAGGRRHYRADSSA
jgi:hypothetical protein